MKKIPSSCRNLIIVLGDQLDQQSAALVSADKAHDVIVMVESVEESTHVWSHKVRTTLFLSAMRHFATWLQDAGYRVVYRKLEVENDATLARGWQAAIAAFKPQQIMCVEPGDLRVAESLKAVASNANLKLQLLDDSHFMCSTQEFHTWAGNNKSLRMEFFYRLMRKKTGVLMDGDQPISGRWNFDAENRKGFGKSGPKNVPTPPLFPIDAITRDVMTLVEQRFAKHPGSLAHFNWPVTREAALVALADFIDKRLEGFGPFEDAMWTTLPFGWHSLLSSAMNLKLLNPREVIAAAELAYQQRGLDLASVEGFIRQILGWREFMRGMYYLDMPAMKTDNFYRHKNALPSWYWTGQTKMNCMKQCINQTLEYGYAHHIQRLMITGMFGVVAEVTPQQICDWYLAVYVDAIEWVELPNTAGMALFANGGRFTSKPYVASGAYVKRMSNYCTGCAYQPEIRTGEKACPMTTLYWNFLDKHEASFASNVRTALMVTHLKKIPADERKAIRAEASRMLGNLDKI
jgi:deoxyribodipyrimidine photolyase-related protein